MRVLSEAEVAEEAGFIERFQLWPRWPVLPVKNINRGTPGYDPDEDLGIVVATFDKVIPEVVLMNLWELTTGPVQEQTEGRRRIVFDSVEAMVRGGWIGD